MQQATAAAGRTCCHVELRGRFCSLSVSSFSSVSLPTPSISKRSVARFGKLRRKQLACASLSQAATEVDDKYAGSHEVSREPSVGRSHWQEKVFSVVIPTYNRWPILSKSLAALEQQELADCPHVKDYEVVVVDDGSMDETLERIEALQREGQLKHVRLFKQEHAGATAARNLGVAAARGDTIIFIDSDMVVVPRFIASHAEALARARARDGDDRAFTYGRVVNTSNFDRPWEEPFKLTDYSAAFFATGNVAISRAQLVEASAMLPNGMGPFDADFSEYGWEDLELGGKREQQRGRNGVRFFRKHPTLNVRLMIQMTPFHHGLWALLTLFGLINERTLAPVLRTLCNAGKPGIALGLLSPVLNWHCVQAVREEADRTLK
eukprot:jgi/Chlat1/1774/Chrsp134S02113